jgi:hypothetical protein
MYLEAHTPSKESPALLTQQRVRFELLPTAGHDHLALDTGEVFARLHKKGQELIRVSIMIMAISSDTDTQYNYILYMDETGRDDFYSPSSILGSVFIQPKAFRDLVENVKNGLHPETITIELPSPPFFTIKGAQKKQPPLEYGSAPDGSRIIWHNKEKENRKIPIQNIRFDYAVAIQSTTSDRISEQIDLIQNSLADILKYLRWTTIGIVALVGIMIGILSLLLWGS